MVPATCPDAPDFLTGYSCDEWYRVGEELHRMQLLTVVDISVLAAYCVAYGRWRTAEEAIARIAANDHVMSGLLIKRDAAVVQNPLVSIARKAAADMVRYASEFGFSPAARSRIATGGASESTTTGKFAGFLAS